MKGLYRDYIPIFPTKNQKEKQQSPNFSNPDTTETENLETIIETTLTVI